MKNLLYCIALLGLIVPACFLDSCATKTSEIFCDDSTPCEQLEEFCDVLGEMGPRNTCVPRPSCSEECSGQVPICEGEEPESLCRGCTLGVEGDAECTTVAATTPVCREDGTCSGCNSSVECSNHATPECTSNGSCQQCTDGEPGDGVCSERDENFPYCIGGACVECDTADVGLDEDCDEPERPICDLNACRGCRDHDECVGSGLAGICNRKTGMCVPTGAVVYVDLKTDIENPSAACGEAPAEGACATIGKALEIVAANGEKTTVSVANGNYGESLVVASDVLIVGTSETETVVEPIVKNTPVVQVSGPWEVVIDTVKLFNAEALNDDASQADGIRCSGASIAVYGARIDENAQDGISTTDCRLRVENSALSLNKGVGIDIAGGTVTMRDATVSDSGGVGIDIAGGTVTMRDATVSDSGGVGIDIAGGTVTVDSSTVVENDEGGIRIRDADFRVVNTFVLGNGGLEAPFGGVSIENTDKSLQVFSFNTVSANTSSGVKGVSCTTTPQMTAENTIVYSSADQAVQDVSGTCVWAYSNIEAGEFVGGGGNIREDPLFAAPTAIPFSRGNFKLRNEPGAVSPCIDRADPNATVERDFEGGRRPNNGRSDMGADEEGVP